MGEDVKWYRVNDPLSPLYGSDVRLGEVVLLAQGGVRWQRIEALRRVDMFIGDRPFQLFAKAGEDLGLMINVEYLVESPIQGEVMEVGDDRPHGLCLDESEMTRNDGVTLRVARYERAIQIALEDSEGNLLATATETGEGFGFWEEEIIKMFARGDDQDDITYALRNN